MAETINKTQSQTFQQITTQQDIKNIFNQSNISLKNKKGSFKERHGGLTIKFYNDVDNTNEKVNDALNNVDTDEPSQTQTVTKEIATQTVTKEIATQTEINEEKNTDNFTKYLYNSMTILENKKIRNIRKKIFNLKEDLKNDQKIEQNLMKIFQKNCNKIKIKDEELYKLEDKLIDIELENNEQNLNVDYWNKLHFHKEKIEDKKNEILKIREKNKSLSKEMEKNTFKIYELESNIYQLTKKLDKYVNVFNIPVNPPLSWIKKSDEVAELHKKIQKVTTEKEFKEIRGKIKKIDKEMKIIWDSKKVEKIYEEILSINNRVYFIITSQHIDNSITEKIMYFQKLINGDIQVINQIKKYENINEYKKDITLIEDVSTNKNNLYFSKMPLKNFIKQQQDFKLTPTKTDWKIWGVISIITFGIPILISCLPFIKKEFATDIKDKITIGLISVTVGLFIKSAASTVSTATKKVDSWFYNKLINNQEKNEKEKKERQSIIKNLTSDKPEIRLETESDILKQELNNNKNKSKNKLINDEIINHNSNNIFENLNIEPVNVNNFDSSIRNKINSQEQPSTSTGIHHSNWIS